MNRKLLLFLFLATGLFSGFFLWRGKALRENPPSEVVLSEDGQTVRTSPVVKPGRRIGEENLITELEQISATTSGRYAVYVYRLGDGSSYGFNQTERMPAASIMKLPVMVAVWKEIAEGKISLSDTYTLDEADRAMGSGPLQFRPAGSIYSVEELLTYLGKNSDNTAWVMFNRRLSKKKMSEAMAEMKMADSSYNDLTVTAEDAAKMLRYIYNGDAGGEEGKEAIYGYLSDSIYEDRIPAAFSDTDEVQIIHKVGTDAGVWADAGIIIPTGSLDLEPFIVVVLNQDVVRAEAQTIVPDMVSRIWKFEKSF